MAFVNEKPMGPEGSINWRTIDYERNAILVSKGSEPGKYSRGGARKFELSWNGEVIPFTLDSKKVAEDGKLNTYWELQKISLPEAMLAYKQEIYQLIHDAVVEWGYIYTRYSDSDVYVDFKSYENAEIGAIL